jgi:isoleucyl-tRNA synthetase
VFNQALCLKKTAKYVILKVWNLKTLFLCTPKFLNNLLYRLNITRFKIIQKADFNKKNINTYCINPVNLKLTPVLFDEYVDLSTGTGVIHLAPNHGFEDYTISLKKNI